MPRFLIDANLPYRFSIWSGPAFTHVFDLGESWTDEQIWDYAQEHDLVVVTKDADFSDRVMLLGSPPSVVHLRIGNMRMRELFAFISGSWPMILAAVENNRLVNVYSDRIETVE